MCLAGRDSATNPQTPHQCIDASGNGGQQGPFFAVCVLCVCLLVGLHCERRHMLWRWSGRRGRSCVLWLVLLLLLTVLVLLLVPCLRQLLLCRRRSGRWRGRRRWHLCVSEKCRRSDVPLLANCSPRFCRFVLWARTTCSRQLIGVHLFLHLGDACKQLLRMSRFALLLACQLCLFRYFTHLHTVVK